MANKTSKFPTLNSLADNSHELLSLVTVVCYNSAWQFKG